MSWELSRHESAISDVPYVRKRLVKNKVTKAASRRFHKYGSFSADETSILALIRFDAVKRNVVFFLAESATSSETAKKNSSQEADTKRERTIEQNYHRQGGTAGKLSKVKTQASN